MKKISKIILMLMVTTASTPSLEASMWDSIKSSIWGKEKTPPPNIRVLVANDLDGAVVEVKGRYSIYDPYTEEKVSTRFIGKSKYIQALKGGLRWGEEFPGLYQLKIKPEDPQGTILVNGIEYKGALYVYDIGGGISLVNEVDIEDYLNSLLALEFNAPLHPETLSAIAIAARTNAYFQTVNPKNTYWAVDAQHTGYQGFAVTEHAKEIEDAVKATRYMVLSQSGNYEGVITPFAAQWGPVTPRTRVPAEQIVQSAITVDQAETLVKKGSDAARILAKAYPGTMIMMAHYGTK